MSPQPIDRSGDADRRDDTPDVEHGGAHRCDACFAFLDALDPAVWAALTRQDATGGTDGRAGTARPRARSSAERAATGVTARSAGGRLHARTAARSRRCRRAAVPGSAGQGRSAGTARRRLDRATPARGRGRSGPRSSRRSRPCSSSATARRWAVARGSPVACCRRCSERERFRHGAQHADRLVEYTNPRYDVHTAGSLSQKVGREMSQPDSNPRPMTLPEKIWQRHLVRSADGEADLLYIDLHLVHEVTSPQAFDGLRLSGRRVRRPDLTVATEDHNVPTADIHLPIADEISAKQVETLRRNTAEFGVTNFPMGDPDQGIVHVIGPEQGRTLPGDDDRLRRQPHRDPWRLRGARLRDRHERGRARARHPDTPPVTAEVDVGHRRRRRCPTVSRPRTSCWRSSVTSARAVASATSSSTAARPSGRCRWRGG